MVMLMTKSEFLTAIEGSPMIKENQEAAYRVLVKQHMPGKVAADMQMAPATVSRAVASVRRRYIEIGPEKAPEVVGEAGLLGRWFDESVELTPGKPNALTAAEMRADLAAWLREVKARRPAGMETWEEYRPGVSQFGAFVKSRGLVAEFNGEATRYFGVRLKNLRPIGDLVMAMSAGLSEKSRAEDLAEVERAIRRRRRETLMTDRLEQAVALAVRLDDGTKRGGDL